MSFARPCSSSTWSVPPGKLTSAVPPPSAAATAIALEPEAPVSPTPHPHPRLDPRPGEAACDLHVRAVRKMRVGREKWPHPVELGRVAFHHGVGIPDVDGGKPDPFDLLGLSDRDGPELLLDEAVGEHPGADLARPDADRHLRGARQ